MLPLGRVTWVSRLAWVVPAWYMAEISPDVRLWSHSARSDRVPVKYISLAGPPWFGSAGQLLPM
jgi:hypothetical protein